MEIKVGDTLRLKKPHPCGGFHWQVLRVGADFRLKCLTCGHVVMLTRAEAERRTKEVIAEADTAKK